MQVEEENYRTDLACQEAKNKKGQKRETTPMNSALTEPSFKHNREIDFFGQIDIERIHDAYRITKLYCQISLCMSEMYKFRTVYS